jgi:hypothetical protein
VGGGSYKDGYLNAGDDDRDPLELLDPLALNGGALERSDLDDPATLLLDPVGLISFLSRATGPDHSLSVAGVLTESSKSSMLLLRPPLVEADPDTRLCVDELALISFSFSFSWKSINMRDRASL